MKWWKNILAFLIAPLGTPVSFAVWSGLAIDPRSFSGILSALPGFFIYATPVAYVATLLLGIPALLVLSRTMCLTLPVIVSMGALLGTITGLFIGFHIASYDINEVVAYFTFDFISIYAPSTISGVVSSGMYWAIRTFSLRGKRIR